MLEEYQNILTTDELSELLRINQRTTIKLVKEGKLPAMKIANQFRFRKDKIVEWLESQMNEYSDEILTDMEKGLKNMPVTIHELLSPTHFCLNLKAKNKDEAIAEMVEGARHTGCVKDPIELLRLIRLRESMTTTGVGRGLAFPHPRSIYWSVLEKTLVVIGTAPHGIDFDAPDGQPVTTIVLIAVPVLSTHLQVMSRLARIFHDEDFRRGILAVTTPEAALALVAQREAVLPN